MKQVLVTGGAGFVGSKLCDRLLELGYAVINVDNFNDYYDPRIKRMNVMNACLNAEYRLIVTDIRNFDTMDRIFRDYKIDVVVHLAALAGVRKSIETPAEYSDVDVTGTINMLELSKKYSVSKFIFASSSSVYGNLPTPFSEQDRIMSQQSPYAAAKFAGEQFCRVYNNLYQIPIVCLRFFTVYGERQRPEMAIHKLTRLVDSHQEIQIYGDGNSFRDYTYVEDVVRGIIASIELKCDFEIFNLGSAHTIKIIDLVKIISDKIGVQAKIRHVNFQNGDVNCTKANIEKAERLLAYKPEMEFELGIERFIGWYQFIKGYINRYS